MSTALGLAMQISANTAQLAQAVQEVNKRLDSIGDAGKQAAEDLGTLKKIEIAKIALGGVRAISRAFSAVSTNVLGAGQSIINFGKSVADELDALNDVANRTGVGVEALQAYSRAAQLAGTDQETFAKAIQRLTTSIGEAVGNDKARKKFEALGVSFDELREKTPTEQFEAIADAIASIGDNSERAAKLKEIFGKSGIELGPLLSDGPGALTKMREEAEALGQVVSEDSVKAIAEMNDAFDKVWMTVKGITGQVVGELAGPISQIAEDLLNVVRSAGPSQIANSIAQGLLDFIDLAGASFLNLAKFIDAFVRKFSTILGIDMSSEAEKELQTLRDRESRSAGAVGMGGQGGVVPQSLRGQALTDDEQRRKQELEKQIEAERNGTVYDVMRESLGQAVDTARARLEERMSTPSLPQSQVGSAATGEQATAGANADQTQLLETIARNTRPPTTVELPR